jgi:hypothetical protein
MPDPIGAPRYSYEQLRRRADDFLRTHNPRGTIPVPIEEIIEFNFGIDIVPMPGLHTAFEVDGFISSDLRTITVDQFVYESRPGRYRFTLAHELAHAILHRRFFAQARFSKVSEWKRFVSDLDEETHGWLEWQAYAFAGLNLVPGLPLKQRLDQACRVAVRKGLSPAQAGDVARLYIVSWLAKQFGVSSQVIEKRLDKDRLWAAPS